jgi:hypothetical protein
MSPVRETRGYDTEDAVELEVNVDRITMPLPSPSPRAHAASVTSDPDAEDTVVEWIAVAFGSTAKRVPATMSIGSAGTNSKESLRTDDTTEV